MAKSSRQPLAMPQSMGETSRREGVRMTDKPVWMVRGGRKAAFIEGFREHGVAALGWKTLGKLSSATTKEEILQLFDEHYPAAKRKTRSTWANQVVRFISEIAVGDYVTTYDPELRVYLLGTVKSDYEWQPKLEDMPHTRKVKWSLRVPRDSLSGPTKNTIGAIQTLFLLNEDAAADLLKNAVAIDEPLPEAVSPAGEATDAEEDLEGERASLAEEALERIKDKIVKLEWDQMQELVAGVLRAMRYRTRVASAGADRGVDVFASPDGLGLEEPRIYVQVKHRQSSASADQIRSFIGGRSKGDKCLFVSTGGFTKDAKYEADRAPVHLTLLDLSDIADWLVRHYDSVDDETRRLVPLTRIYWPTA